MKELLCELSDTGTIWNIYYHGAGKALTAYNPEYRKRLSELCDSSNKPIKPESVEEAKDAILSSICGLYGWKPTWYM